MALKFESARQAAEMPALLMRQSAEAARFNRLTCADADSLASRSTCRQRFLNRCGWRFGRKHCRELWSRGEDRPGGERMELWHGRANRRRIGERDVFRWHVRRRLAFVGAASQRPARHERVDINRPPRRSATGGRQHEACQQHDGGTIWRMRAWPHSSSS
jgi:hypothetical protein